MDWNIFKVETWIEEGADLEHGSQPLRPTTALRLIGYGLSLLYVPVAKQVAE